MLHALSSLWRALRNLKAASEWWAILASAGLLPTATVTYTVIQGQPLEVILMFLMASVAYAVVVLVEAQPLLDFFKRRKGPRVRFREVRGALMHDPQTGVEKFYVVQAWFLNIPIAPSQDSVARNVTGEIEIDRPDGPLRFFGLWAVGGPPDHVGHVSAQTETDILPNGLPVKLAVALKHRGQAFAHAYAAENFTASPKGRHAPYAIGQGSHNVRITLRGIDVNQSLDFILENPGPSGDLSLIPVQVSHTATSQP